MTRQNYINEINRKQNAIEAHENVQNELKHYEKTIEPEVETDFASKHCVNCKGRNFNCKDCKWGAIIAMNPEERKARCEYLESVEKRNGNG